MNPPIKKLAPALSVAAAIAACTATTVALSSDHIDSPTLAQDHGSDLGDTYAVSYTHLTLPTICSV